jgi:hypothetical protein
LMNMSWPSTVCEGNLTIRAKKKHLEKSIRWMKSCGQNGLCSARCLKWLKIVFAVDWAFGLVKISLLCQNQALIRRFDLKKHLAKSTNFLKRYSWNGHWARPYYLEYINDLAISCEALGRFP